MYVGIVDSTSKKEQISKRKKDVAKKFVVDSSEVDVSDIAVSDISAAPSLSNVLALQDVESPIIREREAFDHAQNLLAELEIYRKQMLVGGDASEILAALKQKAEKLRKVTDSVELEKIIKQAEIRVAVEAAKKRVNDQSAAVVAIDIQQEH